MKWLFSIATGMLLTVELAVAQTAPPVFYAESFRKGPTRVTEDMFEIKLTSENPTYTQRIRDSAGAEHYELAVTPKIGEGEGNDKITSWEVSLRDLRHSIYGNVLQFDRELSENPKDNLYWLNPQPTAAVPMRAANHQSRRILYRLSGHRSALFASGFSLYWPHDHTNGIEQSRSAAANARELKSVIAVGGSGTCGKLLARVHL